MFQTFKSTFGVFMYFVTCTPTDNNRTGLTINDRVTVPRRPKKDSQENTKSQTKRGQKDIRTNIKSERQEKMDRQSIRKFKWMQGFDGRGSKMA